ncbi:hypothetical protein ASE74_21795 [Pedobacter sp. Leaf216]|uniref:P-loop NTPase fold protein n=1 Tax=Pedobacter sp. Leaf216 TaxID=1735684 RepID=UPI0006F3CDA6|nr:P-loop NTPase fold protein [Pedobacter sp. Leaf216]KQM72935.1 hypothetical protein ASE74_21795 [Pedobacter sp. Leaf216]
MILLSYALSLIQKQVVEIVAQRIKDQEAKTIISTPLGSGRHSMLIAALANSGAMENQAERIIIISPTITAKASLSVQIEEKLKIPVAEYHDRLDWSNTKILALTIQEYFRFLEQHQQVYPISLIVLMGIEHSKQLKISQVQKDFPKSNVLAFINNENADPEYGEPTFVYSTKQAIEDGILSPVKYLRVNLELSPAQSRLHEYLPQFDWEDEKLFSPDEPINDYLRSLAESIITLIKKGKTIIICPSTAYAEHLSESINQLSESRISSSIHVELAQEQFQEIHTKFKDLESNLQVLLIVKTNWIIDTNPYIQNIIPLKKFYSPQELKDLIQRAQVPGFKEKELLFIDYIGNYELISDLFTGTNSQQAIDPITVPRKHLLESDILFRDKRNIEPVLAANELAQELAEIIKIIPGEQGTMIGIFGTWGRGKTFLMDLVWKELKKSKRFMKVEFHAWKYQDTPATWAYLYESLAERYFDDGKEEHRFIKWVRKGPRLIRLNYQREGLLPILKFIGILTISIIGILLIDNLVADKIKTSDWLYQTLKIPAAISLFFYAIIPVFKKDYAAKAKDIFLKYSSKQSFKDHLGLQAEIQKETLHLLKCWITTKNLGEEKIILFVEDIDRCNEGKVIQIIDSLRVLLEEPQIAERLLIVAAVDERILKLAIRNKYHSLTSLEKTDEKTHHARLNKMTDEYMDKLFISGIKLGKLSIHDRDDFLLALTKSDREKDVLLKTLAEIIQQDQNHQDAKMSPHLQEILIQNDIEEYQQRQADEELLLAQELEDDYIPEYVEPSQTAENGHINRERGKLSAEEIDILRLATKDYSNATPRQIRIFYYRYLMAKNLLARRYRSLGKTNTWISVKNSTIVARLVIVYTIHEEPEILQTHLEDMLASDQTWIDVKLISLVKVDTKDYIELLKILNIVIAY